MKNLIRVTALTVACAFVVFSGGNLGTPAFGQTTSEPLSKTYRVTRANDVEFQKIEPFKVFDNLYYVGPGYVSVWLRRPTQGFLVMFRWIATRGHVWNLKQR